MNISYELKDATTEEEENSLSESERMNLPAKSAPSGYRLATHKYMLAKRKGLIKGPATRTKALKISKKYLSSSIDSEATEEYVELPKNKKRKRRVKKSTKLGRTRTLVTKNYYLRKDGKGSSLNVKPKTKT